MRSEIKIGRTEKYHLYPQNVISIVLTADSILSSLLTQLTAAKVDAAMSPISIHAETLALPLLSLLRAKTGRASTAKSSTMSDVWNGGGSCSAVSSINIAKELRDRGQRLQWQWHGLCQWLCQE